MLKIFLLIFFCFYFYSSAQTDWVKWEKADPKYAVEFESSRRDYNFSGLNFSEAIVKSFTAGYWFFISDVDGDNCPFRPSCSSFLVEAVKETNPPHGVLMFFDRFTRDLNIFNRSDKYPRFGKIHFHDPVYLYTLDEEKIKYLPPAVFFRAE